MKYFLWLGYCLISGYLAGAKFGLWGTLIVPFNCLLAMALLYTGLL